MEPGLKQLTHPQSSLFGSHTRLRDDWELVNENKKAATHRQGSYPSLNKKFKDFSRTFMATFPINFFKVSIQCKKEP